MNDHKARAKATCISRCIHVTCRGTDMCSRPRFDSLLGKMPAWWDYLPDGGDARRSALADALGAEMLREFQVWASDR